MRNSVQTWKNEKPLLEEIELTDMQLVDALGALDTLGDIGLDSLGDDLDLGSAKPNVTSRYVVSSSSPAVPTGSYNKHLVLLALVKNISQIA